jgi:hypothetical protein
MRTGSFALVMALAAGLAAAAAQAAPLYSATWTQHIQGIDVTVTNRGWRSAARRASPP